MWDQFRKALPTVAAACSATKTWGSALLDGESFANASKAAEKKYNSALQSNRLKTAINKGVDKAQQVVEGIADELGLGKTAIQKLSTKQTKAAPKKKLAAKKPVAVKKPAAKTLAKKATIPEKKTAKAEDKNSQAPVKVVKAKPSAKKVTVKAKTAETSVKAAPKKKAPAKQAKKK